MMHSICDRKLLSAATSGSGLCRVASCGAGIPKTTKMKKFLENRPDLFTVDPNTQLVTLKQ